ncbi:MAG: YetF domain-containing protein [Homoserinimonas sp.]
MWFDSWSDVFRTMVIGSAAYFSLIAILRFSGKRTLAQLNIFDFVVTVALGSTLATILLTANVSWSEGVAALALLAGLQFLVALLSSRWPALRSVITSQPAVLVWHGELQDGAIAANRLGRSEVLQAIRSSGRGDVSMIAAVVLESNGTLSVISHDQYGDGSAMGDLGRHG